jgi:hypothetical protein
MAVDFSLLPTEEPVADDPPSQRLWTIVFFVLVLIGVFVVLLLWPKSLSTHTGQFWIALVAFPVGIATFVILRRYSVYEGRKLDAVLTNEACRTYNERVFDAARIPLALVSAAYRFSADPVQNRIDAIRSGLVKLETQASIARDGEPVKARWLVVPEVNLAPGLKEHDRNRHRQVTKWLFDKLFDDLASSLQTLPLRIDLGVQLAVSGLLTRKENEALWQECWCDRQLRRASFTELVAGPVDLNSLDVWLDQLIETPSKEARLIVAIQLHPLLSGSPPAGAAEAGVALLLIPDALASQFNVAHTAKLHRPVRAPYARSNDALSHALKWANLTAADIPGGWQTSFDSTQAGMLRASAVQSGLTVHPTKLDQTVGDVGVAAPWLAVACAADSLSTDIPSQIVFAGQTENLDCTVLRWTSDGAKQPERKAELRNFDELSMALFTHQISINTEKPQARSSL